MSRSMLNASLEYTKQGLPVFPVVPRGKRPLCKHGLHAATTDERTIRAWWRRWPDANIGIPTGRSTFLAVDCDPRNGGGVTIEAYEANHAPLPETWTQRTGGGGWHKLFRHPGGIVRNRSGLHAIAPGFELKGDGGYIVVPPSVHPSGELYVWELEPGEVELAEFPRWLLDLLSHNHKRREPGGTNGEEIPEGQRNEKLTSLAGTMRRRAMTPEEIEAGLLAVNERRCRPPLGPAEVRRIAGSVGRYKPAEPPAEDRANGAPEDVVEACLGSLTEASSPTAVEEALRTLRSRAAECDRLRLQVIRKTALERLTENGLRGIAAMVDAALLGLGRDDDSARQGTAVRFESPDPWPEPVEGAEILEAMESILTRHVILPEGAIGAMVLWALFTYVHDSFTHSPRLAILSPTKRCGKTRALEVLQSFVARPLPTSNITPAAVFRVIERHQPTLLIDEGDTFLVEEEELRGILNSGHTRSHAFVIRTAGENHEPEAFSTWAPVAIALIGKLPATLEDRSVAVAMKRRTKGEKVERFRAHELKEVLITLRRKAVRWAEDHAERLRDADPEMPHQLDDRAEDNWRPLFAIADAAGASWPERARSAARKLSSEREEAEGSLGIQLLEHLHALYAGMESDRWTTTEILDHLTELEDAPWVEYRRGKPLTARQLANLLKPFGVKPRTLKLPGGGTAKGYRLDDLQDAFSRYLSVTSVTSSNDNDLRQSLSVTETP